MTGFDIATASGVYLGSHACGAVYLGSKRVWPASLLSMPLTFSMIEGGTLTWKASSGSYTKTIEYRINGGTWTQLTSTTAGASITVAAGDVVEVRGSNNNYGGNSYYNFFDSTGRYTLRGNIMSLVSPSFQSLTAIPANYCFRNLFYHSATLVDASLLCLPATTLKTACYFGLFVQCSSLVRAPEVLPAETLVQECYRNMFYGTGVTSVKCLATSLSATNCLTNWLYNVPASGMFIKTNGVSWPSGQSGIPTGWTVEEV